VVFQHRLDELKEGRGGAIRSEAIPTGSTLDSLGGRVLLGIHIPFADPLTIEHGQLRRDGCSWISKPLTASPKRTMRPLAPVTPRSPSGIGGSYHLHVEGDRLRHESTTRLDPYALRFSEEVVTLGPLHAKRCLRMQLFPGGVHFCGVPLGRWVEFDHDGLSPIVLRHHEAAARDRIALPSHEPRISHASREARSSCANTPAICRVCNPL
jgi:hypothetical protein